MSCDLTDALFVPGRLATEFRDLALLFAGNHVEVELALSTILDTIAPRAEHEVFNHIDGSRSINTFLEDYSKLDAVHTLGWAHPFKLSNAALLRQMELDFRTATEEMLFMCVRQL